MQKEEGMFIALVLLVPLSITAGILAFKEREAKQWKGLAKTLFFLLWTASTVIITLFIFKNMLKPTVEVKFNTKSWDEMMHKDP